MKFRPIYFSISGIFIAASLFFFFRWGLTPSIDFTGGTVVEYAISADVSVSEIRQLIPGDYQLKNIRRIEGEIVQLQFSESFLQEDTLVLLDEFKEVLGDSIEVLKFETVGPSFSQEILRKTYLAVGIGTLGILLLIAWQFKSLKFGIFAIFAVVHDLIILLGVFSYLGYARGVEVDILVVTAFLTVLSLSVYDTIVVYDRIRENLKKYSAQPMEAVANQGISETIVRSLNTSLTTSFVLFALFLFAGEEIRWFVFALLVGLISGTYSSPFVAVPLLVSWEGLKSKLRG